MTALDEGSYSASLLAVASVLQLLYLNCSLTTLLRSYVVALLHCYVLTLMSNSLISSIRLLRRIAGRQSIMGTAHSVDQSYGAAEFRIDGLESDPVVSRLITCQPKRGHKASETHLVRLNQGLVPRIV